MTDTSRSLDEEEQTFDNKLIKEFRQNGGRVGAEFEGADLLLLTTTGARTGQRRTVPLGYRIKGGRYHIMNGSILYGASKRSGWYHNLRANPHAIVEVDSDTFDVSARVLEGDERLVIWKLFESTRPSLAGWQHAMERGMIPILELVPKN